MVSTQGLSAIMIRRFSNYGKHFQGLYAVKWAIILEPVFKGWPHFKVILFQKDTFSVHEL